MSGTCFFFSSRRRHTRCSRDWSSDVCSSDLFAEAGVKSAFHAGYSNGRYLFYLLRKGIDCGGTDLELTEAPENEGPASVFEDRVLRRLLRGDFFEFGGDHLRSTRAELPLDVLFTEATLS